MLKTNLPYHISTIEEAKAFLNELHSNNETFHPEDDALEIVWRLPIDQQPTIKDKQNLNSLMSDIYELEENKGKDSTNLVFCPCEYLLSIIDK